jgi:hypothetical protein
MTFDLTAESYALGGPYVNAIVGADMARETLETHAARGHTVTEIAPDTWEVKLTPRSRKIILWVGPIDPARNDGRLA